jgi:Cu-processing system permease protein
MVLLKLDVSAMMGYTGAIFKNIFGTTNGQIATLVLILFWVVIPYFIALRKFNKKDI